MMVRHQCISVLFMIVSLHMLKDVYQFQLSLCVLCSILIDPVSMLFLTGHRPNRFFWCRTCWNTNPYFRGAYSLITPDLSMADHDILREPLPSREVCLIYCKYFMAETFNASDCPPKKKLSPKIQNTYKIPGRNSPPSSSQDNNASPDIAISCPEFVPMKPLIVCSNPKYTLILFMSLSTPYPHPVEWVGLITVFNSIPVIFQPHWFNQHSLTHSCYAGSSVAVCWGGM